MTDTLNNLLVKKPDLGLTQFIVMLAFMTQYPTSEVPENYYIQWNTGYWLIWEQSDDGIVWQAQVEYHGRSGNRKTLQFRVFHDAYRQRRWHTLLVPSDFMVVKQINGGA